jgi:hypothetical protein
MKRCLFEMGLALEETERSLFRVDMDETRVYEVKDA